MTSEDQEYNAHVICATFIMLTCCVCALFKLEGLRLHSCVIKDQTVKICQN